MSTFTFLVYLLVALCFVGVVRSEEMELDAKPDKMELDEMKEVELRDDEAPKFSGEARREMHPNWWKWSGKKWDWEDDHKDGWSWGWKNGKWSWGWWGGSSPRWEAPKQQRAWPWEWKWTNNKWDWWWSSSSSSKAWGWKWNQGKWNWGQW